MTGDERLKAGVCIITGCGKAAFCKSAWCAIHAIMANSKHQPDIYAGPLVCTCRAHLRGSVPASVIYAGD